MKLRFFAREDLLVAYPGLTPVVGQPQRYVGRTFVAPHDGLGAAHPAKSEPDEFDADSEEGKRLIFRVRRNPCLWPADKETAAACGLQFTPVECLDGVVTPKSQPSRKSSIE